MTKNSQDNLQKFVDNLENEKITPNNQTTQNNLSQNQEKPEIITKKQDQILLEELKSHNELGATLIIWRNNFTSFIATNLTLAIAFLGLSFALIFYFGDIINSYSNLVLSKLPFLKILNISNILHLSLGIVFWLFFTYLRSCYLVIISNYLQQNYSKGNFSFGLSKILSFILAEIMQIVMFIIGIFMIILSPLFGAKYYLTLPIIYNQNDSAINAMFESKEYCRYRLFFIMKHMFLITFVTIALVAIGYFITQSFISNNLTLISLNLLIFTLVILPFNSCYRFFIYKKTQDMTGEMRFRIGAVEKTCFVLLRIGFLGLLVLNIFLITNGSFGSAVDKVIMLLFNQ